MSKRGKNKRKGKKGKSKGTTRERMVYTNEQKFFAHKLKKEWKSARVIMDAFKDRYGFKPASNILNTFYKKGNMLRYERYIST